MVLALISIRLFWCYVVVLRAWRCFLSSLADFSRSIGLCPNRLPNFPKRIGLGSLPFWAVWSFLGFTSV